MLEGLVVWILNTYIGEYLENLNTDQLSVGLLQGQVDLENVPLKKESWNSLNWPIEIKAGIIGKIKILIPVYRLHSEPWVISVEKLSVILGPASSAAFAKDCTEQSLRSKLRALQSHEAAWRASQNEKEASSTSYYTNWKTYSASVFANIAENIQLNVRDVHIRYEDDVCCGSDHISCGVIVRSLTAHSTDKNWMPTFNKNADHDLTWKLVELQGLSVYWDSNVILMGNLEAQQMMNLMEKHLEKCITPDNSEKRHEFIVSAVDATARLRRNCSACALKSLQNPRVVCDIHLEKIPVFISQAQYQQVLDWEKNFHSLCLRWSNRKFRPTVPVSSSPRAWWLYAVSVSMEPVWSRRRSRTWNVALEHAKDIKDYVHIYHKCLKTVDSLPVEVEEKKQALESKLSLDSLLILRKLVTDKIEEEKSAMNPDDKHLQGKGFLQWLFPSWIGWYSSKEDGVQHGSIDSNEATTLNLEEEILGVLDSATDDATLMKRDVLFAQISFTLQQGTFSLLQTENSSNGDDVSRTVIELEFSDMTTRFETRPKLKSAVFTIKLGALYVHDRINTKSNFPQVVAPQNKEVWFTSHSGDTVLFPVSSVSPTGEDIDSIGNQCFFELLYENNPYNVDADVRLSVKSKSLVVVLNVNLLEVLLKFFSSYNSTSARRGYSFSSTARMHYENLKEQTKAELQQTFDRLFAGGKTTKSKWCIEFDIAAPQFVIPFDVFNANTSMVIFDFGELHAHNSRKHKSLDFSSAWESTDDEENFHTPCSTPEELGDSTVSSDHPLPSSDSGDLGSALLERIYERYSIELKNVQVLVTTLKDSWKFAQLRGSSSLHVLNRSSLTVEVHRRILMVEESENPDFTVLAWLPKLNAHISENKVSVLSNCVGIVHSFFYESFIFEQDPSVRTYLPHAENVQHSSESAKKEPAFSIDIGDHKQNRRVFLHMQFQVDEIFFDLQNQNQSIAEVQVCGLKSSFLKHLQETLLVLSVDSLLVVDASQTYGPDFELLVASHKNVSMDSHSGKLENSGSSHFSDHYQMPSYSPLDFRCFLPFNVNKLPLQEPYNDALISCVVKISTADDDPFETTCSASINFNSLDAIVNQETIIQIIRLLKKISGTECNGEYIEEATDSLEMTAGFRPYAERIKYSRFIKTELDFNFHSLNLLFLRAVGSECEKRKLATATLCDFCVKTKTGPNSLGIEGTLGSIQLLDLITDETKYDKILSFSPEIVAANSETSPSEEKCKDDNKVSFVNSNYALCFHITKERRVVKEKSVRDAARIYDLCVTAKMASICYTHCSDFLVELSSCAAEFKNFLRTLSVSVKTAAAEVAKGIVSSDFSLSDAPEESISKSCDVKYASGSFLDVRCNIYLMSPVLIMPLSSSYPEAFVAHLGHVVANNEAVGVSEKRGTASAEQKLSQPQEDNLNIAITGINVFFVNLNKKKPSQSNRSPSKESSKQVIKLHGSEYSGCVILDNTSVDINVFPFHENFISEIVQLRETIDHQELSPAESSRRDINIIGKICCPVKIFLNKNHYEKMMNLMQDLSGLLYSQAEPVRGDYSSKALTSGQESFGSSFLANSQSSVKGFEKSLSFNTAFSFPRLEMEVNEELSVKGSSFRISFEELLLTYEHQDSSKSSLKVSLHSFIVQDLQSHLDITTPMTLISPKEVAHDHLSTSYGVFKDGKTFAGSTNLEQLWRKLSCSRSVAKEKPLLEFIVYITSETVEDDEPHVKKVNYFIPVNFSGIKMVFSLHSWISLLNFFSNDIDQSERIFAAVEQTVNVEDVRSSEKKNISNIELELNVGSLDVVLSKPGYDLASLNIDAFSSWISLKENCFRLEGKLDSMLIRDLTAFGTTYPERLKTEKKNSVNFQFLYCRGSENAEDPCKTSFVHIKAQFRPIVYVHTQRFITEVIVFWLYFHEKQRIFSSKMNIQDEGSYYFVFFDIQAQSPSILIPPNADSLKCLVITLNSVDVKNKIFLSPDGKKKFFKVSDRSEEGLVLTKDEVMREKNVEFSKDEINITLADFHLLTGLHSRAELKKNKNEKSSIEPSRFLFPSYFVSTVKSLLQEMFTLELVVERLVSETPCFKVPEIMLRGTLSTVHVCLGLEEYKLFRSIISDNFGESLEECIFDPCKEVEQFVLMDASTDVIPKFAAHLKLFNACLVLHCDFGNLGEESPLAKFDFVTSYFSFVTHSDNSKDVDLVLNEIHVTDIRYKNFPANNRPNVFSNVIFPNRKNSTNSLLQAELHYRVTHEFAKLTLLLNNMRVMGIMDFIINTYKFLTCPMTPAESTDTKLPVVPIEQKVVDHAIEIKINFSSTEFVMVEYPSKFDSAALILKSTAVMTWKPNNQEKLFSCSLQSFEMSSCTLGVEDATSWTVIEPMNIGIDLLNKHVSPSKKMEYQNGAVSLEVYLSRLNAHVSYDVIKSIAKILDDMKFIPTFSNSKDELFPPKFSDIDIQILNDLGFSVGDCTKALLVCQNNINDAALWLTQNAQPLEKKHNLSEIQLNEELAASREKWPRVHLLSAEMRLESISVFLIHEWQEASLPVLSFILSDGTIFQNMFGHQDGSGTITFSIAHYNACLSGWEPLVEPCRCKMIWNYGSRQHIDSSQKIFMQISADDVLNVNFTSSCMKLYNTVKNFWNNSQNGSHSERSLVSAQLNHETKRAQQVPCMLKNDTGVKLLFATQVITLDRYMCDQSKDARSKQRVQNLVFSEIKPGDSCPLIFHKNAKLENQVPYQMFLHQIIVQLEGWNAFLPVSIDKVGVFFRQAQPLDQQSALPAGSVIFRINLEKGIQKSVVVESILSLKNVLDDDLEVKLQMPLSSHRGQDHYLCIRPGKIVSVPLQYVYARMFIRPRNRSVFFCEWDRINPSEKEESVVLLCNSLHASGSNYRLCASIRNIKNLESKQNLAHSKSPKVAQSEIPLPGHMILISSCFEIVNLLPCEMHYEIKEGKVSGRIKPGLKQSLCQIDISKCFSFKLSFENFKQINDAVITLKTHHYPSYLTLYDREQRPLNVHLKVKSVLPDSFKMYIYVQYWFVNRTGLPLVIKQEGAQTEAAGQFVENEIARSMLPLMFSFADEEASAMCTMRIGKSLHSEGVPLWCARFRLEKGIRCRRLHVARSATRPDWVYNTGIEITSGEGMYRDTNIVIVSPRYQLDNRSQHTIEFCQKFAAEESREFVLSAMSGCSLPFHWLRIDLDNLLCVRIADIPQCCWSGGFPIDKIQSFHINMRDADGTSHFLQTEIVLHGATFYTIFTDAECFPPPIRVDNYSEVPVTYYQTNVTEERLKTTVRPHTSVPYAWDDPMLPPYITCSAPGGSAATYNTNIFSEGSQLFYENFIYITFSATFLKSNFKDMIQTNAPPEVVRTIADQELVLDVPSGSRVILSKMEAGKRTQLWRMTSNGLLQHEGSSPPSDLNKSQSAVSSPQRMVLDIAAVCPQPGESTPLMLRKPDVRRHLTQTWRFTPDGRLCCGYANLCVQSEGNHLGLRVGSSAVLGPVSKYSPFLMVDGIPIDQAVSRKKLREGSGVLCVSIVPDGPTRVLKVTDLKNKANVLQSPEKTENIDRRTTKSCESSTVVKTPYSLECQLFLKLKQGLGVSVVNHLNEDLVYMHLRDITIELNRTSSALILDGSVRNIQVDNQLREGERPVVIFATSANKVDGQHHLPDVHLTVHRISTNLTNVEIFKNFIVTVKNLTVHLEEYLLMKIIQLYESFSSDNHHKTLIIDSNEFQSSLFRHDVSDRRYYFSTLKLSLQQVRLSVFTADCLPSVLQEVKSRSGLHLIRFEDAQIELDPFLRVHPFETAHFLMESIFNHYKEELKSQAARILGSVDFLGNPLGLVNDVTDGISELINEGNLGGLIKNVAHGLSDSAVKLSETISDGLGIVAIDEKHQRMRKQIRQGCNNPYSSGNDHLVAGIQGLGIGLLGGVTSLFTQTYEGLSQEGIQGFFSGFGKGLVGTVAKPAIGFLDLASGAASAVRDTSKRDYHSTRSRLRPPRLYVGPERLLPQYSPQHASDQELLYKLNNREYSELFIAKESIRSEGEEIQVIVSTKKIRFLNSSSAASNNTILNIPLEDVIGCAYASSLWGTSKEIRHYLQLSVKDSSYFRVQAVGWPSFKTDVPEGEEWSFKKPFFRCDTKELAEKVLQQIHYAKYLLEEKKLILSTERDVFDNDVLYSK